MIRRWPKARNRHQRLSRVFRRERKTGESVEQDVMVVHSGNRIDHPDRQAPRFPPDREQAVAARVSALLEAVDPLGVVTAGAAGADLLMIEGALHHDIPVHLVLPFDPEQFRRISVADQGEGWAERFDRALDHIAAHPWCSVTTLDLPPDESGFRGGNEALVERALALAPGQVLAVAVRPRNGESERSMTDDFVDRAEAAALSVVGIDPRG